MTTPLFWWIVVGLIAGAIGKGSRYGMLADVLLGVVGAILGGWITSVLVPASREVFMVSMVGALAGAGLLIRITGVLRGKPKRTSAP